MLLRQRCRARCERAAFLTAAAAAVACMTPCSAPGLWGQWWAVMASTPDGGAGAVSFALRRGHVALGWRNCCDGVPGGYSGGGRPRAGASKSNAGTLAGSRLDFRAGVQHAHQRLRPSAAAAAAAGRIARFTSHRTHIWSGTKQLPSVGWLSKWRSGHHLHQLAADAYGQVLGGHGGNAGVPGWTAVFGRRGPF